MRFKKEIAASAVLSGLIILSGCGGSSTGWVADTITVDLVKDYTVVQTGVKLTKGTPLVADELAAENRFLFDVNFPDVSFPGDSGLDTTIINLNADGNGTARSAPSASNGYDTNATLPLTWEVNAEGRLVSIVGSGVDRIDVLMIPINDTVYSSSNVLAEINDTIGVETRYPSALVPAASFDAATTYTNSCVSCHGAVPGDLIGFTADTLEVRMIQIKDNSLLTPNTNMNNALDVYSAGELRLLAEYIVSTY